MLRIEPNSVQSVSGCPGYVGMPAISDDDRFALSAVGSGQHGVKELRIGFVAANLLADEYLVNVRRYAAFVQFGRLHFGPSVGNNIDFEVGLQ